jgi:hypothetical protein
MVIEALLLIDMQSILSNGRQREACVCTTIRIREGAHPSLTSPAQLRSSPLIVDTRLHILVLRIRLILIGTVGTFFFARAFYKVPFLSL